MFRSYVSMLIHENHVKASVQPDVDLIANVGRQNTGTCIIISINKFPLPYTCQLTVFLIKGIRAKSPTLRNLRVPFTTTP